MLGAIERVWPRMMTVIAITAGFVPILWEPAPAELAPGNGGPRDTGREEGPMMHDMMGAMGWGMGLAGLIGIVVLVLVIAALVKYVFFR